MKKILLIDGNSIMNRAYYALPLFSNKEGEYTNAVYGFLNIFFKIYDEENPDYAGIAFDLPRPTFRHIKYEAYKGTRKSMPEELRPQFPLLKQLLAKMQIPIYEMEGYEADDILGTLATCSAAAGLTPVVVSGDRDLLQLAGDKIKIRLPKTKAGKTEIEDYYEKDVIERIGVTPSEYIDVKALMGDTSDNIPGVPGIGEKTALKIIQDYKNVETAILHAVDIKPKKASENLLLYQEQALMSKELATIITNVPIDFDPKCFEVKNIYTAEALDEIKRLEFKTLLPRFSKEAPAITNDSGDYLQITDAGEAKSYMAALSGKDKIACALVAYEEEVLGLSFCCEEDKSVFIRINPNITETELADICRSFLASAQCKIFLDSKKALAWSGRFQADIQNICFDASLAGYILNSSKSAYDYNDIAFDFLSETYPSPEEFFGKGKNRQTVEDLPAHNLTAFACRQAQVVYRAYEKMAARIEENGQHSLYYDIELPLAAVLKNMESYGIKVDKDALTQYGIMLDEAVSELTKDIFSLAEEEFNINSTQQLGVILFEKLGLKAGKKTKTGYSTAHEVLEKLTDHHPIISKILDYRSLTKLKSTYVDGLLSVIHPSTGKIHSTFNQTITTTGRISSSEPNLQNIPIRLPLGRGLRKVFIPTDDSYVFIDGDYSQIELRVLAHMSRDEVLIRAFQEGQDIHRLTASQVFKTPLDQVTPSQRGSAKAVNFGIIYGMGAFSLGQDLKISKKEAERYIEGYFEKYPGVKRFLDESVNSAKESGYASTIFNRRRSIPELGASNFVQRSFGERVAMNMPVQGSAADIIKIAMVKVHRRLKEEGLASRLILQVHDELLIEAKKEEAERVKDILRQEMEGAAALAVPLETDLHQGETWFDAK